MGENSAISWTDDTFNPWIGCAKVSPACDGCYAEAMMAGRYGRVEWGGPGKGEGMRSRTAASTWKLPRKWNREQEAYEHNCSLIGEAPAPRFVFCASLADVFDNAVPTEWRRDLFDLIHATPNLTWLLLTKRPGNIVKLFTEALSEADKFMLVDPPLTTLADCWPRNAAIGCTVVSQAEADRDIPKLLAAKAALNPAFAFLSMEPLLGPVDLLSVPAHGWWAPGTSPGWPARASALRLDGRGLDWVIAGGETDQGAHKARPSHPDWFRDLRDQCAAAGVRFHFKQWGEWTPGENAVAVRGPLDCAWRFDEAWDIARHGQTSLDSFTSDDEPDLYRIGKARAGRLLDGVTHDARPEVRR